MKKLTQNLLNTLVFTILLLFIGCAKQGCTDPVAVNYDSDAKKDNGNCEYIYGCMNENSVQYNSLATKDDGTCTFEGSVVFWFDLATSDSLYYSGSDYLDYYVDGELIGTDSVQYYWNSAPDCSQQYTMTSIKNLGSDTAKSFDYSVVDDLGYQIWVGTVEFDANQCWAYKLNW